MSCREQLEGALADAPQVIVGTESATRFDAAVERVAALPADCSGELVAYAEERFADFSAGAPQLALVLEAMLERGQDIAALAARALTAPGSAEREPFVDLLVRQGAAGAATALAEAFGEFDAESDPDGFLRARILAGLGKLGERDVAPTVASGLRHDDALRVRLEAVEALDRLDARDQAPALIERLEQDQHPDVVAAAADVLGPWGATEALPALEELAASDWAQRSPEVRDGVARALSRLRA